MRFLLKSAFWLGLIAFLLPFGGGSRETAANITFFGTLAGAEEALQDLTGFCGRAPQACSAGREVALFAGERIGDGIQMAYGLVQDHAGRAAAVAAPPPAETASAAPAFPAGDPADLFVTGTVKPAGIAAAHRPAPYMPPRGVAAALDAAAAGLGTPSPLPFLPASATIPTPTPAPRA